MINKKTNLAVAGVLAYGLNGCGGESGNVNNLNNKPDVKIEKPILVSDEVMIDYFLNDPEVESFVLAKEGNLEGLLGTMLIKTL